jgi:sulfide:quinone oxidoreductase
VRRVVILGAGFGGLTLATELNPLAQAGKAEITLIERSPTFSMGFSMQWVLVGRRRPEDGQRPYKSFQARYIKLIQEEAIGLNTTRKTASTKSRKISYDDLVIATGAELTPSLVHGLAEDAYNLCDMASVVKMKRALETIQKGTVIVAIASVPFKCPPAPYEYALLIDDMLRQRGIRQSVRIVVTTPEPQPMPVAGKMVGEQVKAMLASRGIEFMPGHKPKGVDVAKRTVSYEDGTMLTYDLLAAMPPHRAPRVVRDAGLADASGFVPVDLWTFKTNAPNVYAVGDVAALKLPNGNPHPKAGVFAEAQASTLAMNLAAQISGGQPVKYPGTGACYVDVGQGMAAAAEANLLAPEGPRVVLAPPSKEALEAKAQFERERLNRWFGR